MIHTGLFHQNKEEKIHIGNFFDNLILRELHPGQVCVALVNDVKFFDRFNEKKLEKVFSIDALSKTMQATLLKQAQAKTINDRA